MPIHSMAKSSAALLFLLGASSLTAHAADDALALRGGRILAGKTAKSSVKSSKSAKSSKMGKALFGVRGPTTDASKLASDLHVMIKMGKNFDHGADCSAAEWNLCYTQTLMLDYSGDNDYSDTQFNIYFSSIHRLLQVNHPDFEHHHVIGDLTYIKPTSSFKGFGSRTEIEIPLVFEFWSVQMTDKMPRWFVQIGDDHAVIENTDTEDMHSFVAPYTSTMKTPNDANIPMNTQSRFALNEEKVEVVDATEKIIPTPYKVEVASGAQAFDINGVSIVGMDLLGDLKVGASDLMNKLGVSSSGSHQVSLKLGSLPADISGPESYTMEIRSDGTSIAATEPAGLFHGMMSFIGLLNVADNESMTLKEMDIHDKPRFTYRGHQVDTARNFRYKDTIMKTIDAMALWKLNVLHLALTNDEGWRLEIPGLEELTVVGSKRCFDPTEETCLLTQLGSGPEASDTAQFYTRQEYIDILRYAQERNVKIIPEFNMPAHARAAVISMEARAKKGDDTYRLTDPEDETHLLTIQFYDRTSIINPCLDSSVRFVEKLVGEVKQMHDEAGVPLDTYHFGGDEAKNILLGGGFGPDFANYPEDQKQKPFSKSPACQAKVLADPSFDIDAIANYWAITVNRILAKNGIGEMVAWEDGLRGTTKDQYDTPSVAINFWETLYWGGTDGLANIAEAGFDIIMSNPDYTYFDFPYEVNAEERGYYWGTRFNSVYKVFTFAPENLPQNAETSKDRDGNDMSVKTPDGATPVITGMQGQSWSETIRTDDQYYEMTFPRVLSIAERAWHRGSWELDWSPGVTYDSTTGIVPMDELTADYHGFVTKLGCHEMFKMKKLGINYRVPPPGGSIASGIMTANSELPCTPIMYSTNEGNTWSEYSGPVSVGDSGVVHLQSTSSDGALKSRIVSVDAGNDAGKNTVDSHGCSKDTLPSLVVPHCDNGRGTVTINKRLGTLAADFPEAAVELCFTDKTLELTFEAQRETSYLVDDTYANNDPIWEKTVMEAFIATGDHDPTGYLEFEVAPNNKLWTGWIHNPNKDFTSKATAFIDDWDTYPITSATTRDVSAQTWKSVVSLPLSMFNVEEAEGTQWRMNFFRTYYADESSEQEYGAWNPNKLISFHQTPCFGKVQFAT